jgi:hypothetical protein
METLAGKALVRPADPMQGHTHLSQEVDNALVKVVTTQVGVTRGGQHLKHTITDLQGPVESTTPKSAEMLMHI